MDYKVNVFIFLYERPVLQGVFLICGMTTTKNDITLLINNTLVSIFSRRFSSNENLYGKVLEFSIYLFFIYEGMHK